MSNSSLVTVKVPAHKNNYWGDRKGAKINKIIIHHMAAVWTAKRCGESFQNPSRGASSNYGIGNDGDIGLYVPENLCSGASGGTKNGIKVNGYEIDRYAVTIETSNSSTEGNWPVSDKALKSLIKLVADIAKRNGLGKLVKGKNLCWHQMYAATACPGPYLLSKMDYIVSEANKINDNNADPNGWDYPYSRDSGRSTDSLILYTKGTSTKTNKWGRECHISPSGVVLDAPVYGKGNMSLNGNRVLSGHGKASQWMSKIKVGYHIYFNNGRCFIDAGKFRQIDSINGNRQTNYLVKYTKSFTNNIYGTMVAIDKNGIAINNPVYGLHSLAIPSKGYVLSGHGASSKWLRDNVKKGSKITIVGSAIKVN